MVHSIWKADPWLSQKEILKKNTIKHRKLSVTIELISFGKHSFFSINKTVKKMLMQFFCLFFFFLVIRTYSCEWSQKDHFFLCYYSIGTKPKLYNNSLPFPMPSQTHKPLLLNTLTLISQVFQSMFQRQRELVCFRDQKLSGKKRMVRAQRMETSQYVRNRSHKSHTNEELPREELLGFSTCIRETGISTTVSRALRNHNIHLLNKTTNGINTPVNCIEKTVFGKL